SALTPREIFSCVTSLEQPFGASGWRETTELFIVMANHSGSYGRTSSALLPC
ncbi:unnamed protein product, partial [Citrullus colocynthis]